MKNSVREDLETKNFLERYGFLFFSLLYLALAFRLLPDFGLGFDSPKNFKEGSINLNYLLTGHVSPADQRSISFQIHGAFFFMLADIFKRVLSDGLGWLDPVSARHAFLPILVFSFMNLYYVFLKKRTGTRTAFLACALLLTTPSFFGHAFNNIKDIPLFIFFSFSILCFYEWRDSGFQKRLYLYGTFLALGLTFLSKVYAVLVPAILVLWLVFLKFRPAQDAENMPPQKRKLWTRQNLFHGLMGLVLILILMALFFMPAFYVIQDKLVFLEIKGRAAHRLMQGGTQGWSFFPWIQVFFVIPVLTLVMAVWGMVKTFRQRSQSALSALMLVWFFTVMLTACTPIFPVYNGIRLFMVFLVPFCFFSSVGINSAVEFLGVIPPLRKNLAAWVLGCLLIAIQIAGIIQTHPYETAFFNRLAGGLKGAQEKQIPDASDFWLTSYREASRWINENAPPFASLWLPSSDGFFMMRLYPLRWDLKFDYARNFSLPPNSFLVLTPGTTCWANVNDALHDHILREAGSMRKVHTIKRQGGEILSIYYKP